MKYTKILGFIFVLLITFCVVGKAEAATTVASTGDVGRGSSSYVGADGFARIGYYDVTNTDYVFVRCTNTTCSSSVSTIVDSNVTALSTDNDRSEIIENAAGFATMVYSNAGGEIRMVYCSNADCSSRTSRTSMGTGRWPSIALNGSGLPRISFYNTSSIQFNIITCTDVSCGSTSTTAVGPSGSLAGGWGRIVVANDGYVRGAFYVGGSNTQYFVQCTNTDCSTNSTNSVFTGNNSGYHEAIYMDATSGFARTLTLSQGTTTVNYIQCSNANCTSNSVTNLPYGSYMQMYRGSDGFARISLKAATVHDLLYIRCTNASCSTNVQTTIDSANATGYFTDINVGPNGYPMISYQDQTNSDLMFFACGNDDCTVEATNTTVPTVGSPSQSSITYNSATLGGNVTSDGGASVSGRGVCRSTSDSTPTIAEGATCTSMGSGTGVFTGSVGSLTPSTFYYYAAYATNSQGTAYSSTDSFTTASNLPTGTDTSAAASVNSYYATLKGAANPNGFQTYGHFRVFTTNPGNCNSDAGGTRFPEQQANDINLGSGTSLVTAPTFQFTIPFNGSAFLVPNQNYWYCAYAVGTNGTGGASTIQSFITPDGPNSPCDAPTGGNFSMPSGATCSIAGTFGGVDAGGGTTNTATLGINGILIVGASQKIARGSMTVPKGSKVTLAQGSSIIKGGIYVHDKDGDGILDDKTSYVGSTPSASNEFVRRNTLSTTYNYAWKVASISGTLGDCNPDNAYVNRYVPGVQMVTDADNDGYKTSAAASNACVGAQTTINTRTYFNDATNTNSWLPSTAVLGGGATDCQDTPNGAPCAVTSVSASGVSQTSTSVSWSNGGTGAPSVSTYDLLWCDRTSNGSCTPSTQITNVTSPYTHNSGLSCGRTYAYIIRSNNGGGTTDSSVYTATTSSCASAPTVTTATTVTNSTTTAGGLQSTVNANGADAAITYRWGTSSQVCASLPNTVSGGTALANAGAVAPNSAVTTSTLTAGQQYWYCATANNGVGGTINGNVVNLRTIPAAPTNPSATPHDGNKWNTITWTGSTGATAYYIYWCSGAACTPSTQIDTASSGTGYQHQTLSCGTTYRYQVSAYNSAGESSKSSIVQGVLSSGTHSCYTDADGDSYRPSGYSTVTGCGSSSSSCASGYTSNNIGTDCYDSNSQANPGQSQYFTSNRGDGSYDYNCDGSATKANANICTGTGSASYYWDGFSCNAGSYFVGCYNYNNQQPTEACGAAIGSNVACTGCGTYWSDAACSFGVHYGPTGGTVSCQ